MQGRDHDSRFIRVNLDLGGEPPKLDEKQKLSELQDAGTKFLQMDETRVVIESIAHRLVASTFYFRKKRFWFNEEYRTWTCSGTVIIHLPKFISAKMQLSRAHCLSIRGNDSRRTEEFTSTR